tara:strand:- start:15569 stop:16093 length:525 start_codon:yes stop_codon:yes gene_type:complete
LSDLLLIAAFLASIRDMGAYKTFIKQLNLALLYYLIKMVNTLDMQDLRQLNLFQKVTGIRTRFCFEYNNMVLYCVPKPLVAKAVGKEASNLKRIGQVLKKRIKIIPIPEDGDVKAFIQAIVSPVEFKELEVKEDEVILAAGPQSKAALLGRNKRRLLEMQEIIKGFFGKGFRII